MADNVNIQESPPEVQFAGVSRWLRENLFSSTGSSILTFISIGALVGLFRSIIGFFISPEREWTAITYNLRLYMVQAYPCLLYTSPSPRDRQKSRMPSSA